MHWAPLSKQTRQAVCNTVLQPLDYSYQHLSLYPQRSAVLRFVHRKKHEQNKQTNQIHIQ